MTKHDTNALLTALDALPLECDGLTRVISALLQREGVQHEIRIGSVKMLYAGGESTIPYHMWIRLPEGRYIDLRARMWLGIEAPHGVFDPRDIVYRFVRYETTATADPMDIGDRMFCVLTGYFIDEFMNWMPSIRKTLED